MYACMYVMYVCMYVCMYACLYVCNTTKLHVRMYVCKGINAMHLTSCNKEVGNMVNFMHAVDQ